jgi:esterase/lipase superfamily enzyme
MGGNGTLLMALKTPRIIYCGCTIKRWNPYKRRTDQLAGRTLLHWVQLLGTIFGIKLKGEERLTEHFMKNYIPEIIRTGDADKFKTVKFYIDCGDDDFLIKGNMELHALMIDKEIPHEFRVRNGGHNWEYWRTALPEVFRFVSAAFHR